MYKDKILKLGGLFIKQFVNLFGAKIFRVAWKCCLLLFFEKYFQISWPIKPRKLKYYAGTYNLNH